MLRDTVASFAFVRSAGEFCVVYEADNWLEQIIYYEGTCFTNDFLCSAAI